MRAILTILMILMTASMENNFKRKREENPMLLQNESKTQKTKKTELSHLSDFINLESFVKKLFQFLDADLILNLASTNKVLMTNILRQIRKYFKAKSCGNHYISGLNVFYILDDRVIPDFKQSKFATVQYLSKCDLLLFNFDKRAVLQMHQGGSFHTTLPQGCRPYGELKFYYRSNMVEYVHYDEYFGYRELETRIWKWKHSPSLRILNAIGDSIIYCEISYGKDSIHCVLFAPYTVALMPAGKRLGGLVKRSWVLYDPVNTGSVFLLEKMEHVENCVKKYATAAEWYIKSKQI